MATKKKVSDLAVSAGKAAKVKGGPTPHRKRTVVLQQS